MCERLIDTVLLLSIRGHCSSTVWVQSSESFGVGQTASAQVKLLICFLSKMNTKCIYSNIFCMNFCRRFLQILQNFPILKKNQKVMRVKQNVVFCFIFWLKLIMLELQSGVLMSRPLSCFAVLFETLLMRKNFSSSSKLPHLLVLRPMFFV